MAGERTTSTWLHGRGAFKLHLLTCLASCAHTNTASVYARTAPRSPPCESLARQSIHAVFSTRHSTSAQPAQDQTIQAQKIAAPANDENNFVCGSVCLGEARWHHEEQTIGKHRQTCGLAGKTRALQPASCHVNTTRWQRREICRPLNLSML